MDLSRFCSGFLRAILAIKETGYGSKAMARYRDLAVLAIKVRDGQV